MHMYCTRKWRLTEIDVNLPTATDLYSYIMGKGVCLVIVIKNLSGMFLDCAEAVTS